MAHSVILEETDFPARKEDVSSLDGILRAFYEIVSGPAGQVRDWARDRTLYAPGALMVPTGVRDARPHIQVLDHDAYVERSNPVLASGFYEQEIHRVTRTFGNITHVFSTYEGSLTPDGPVIVRGINSIELVNDGRRWWIVAALWDTEREGNQIPPEFLPEEERS